MGKRNDTAIIVVAGGRGERFGAPGGKQLAEVSGIPVLGHTLLACLGVSRAGLVVAVCDPERVDEYAERLAGIVADPKVRFVPGGERRQDSVAAGLSAVPQGVYTYVAVHDGARPLVTPATFERALEKLDDRGDVAGVVVGHPSFDTLKIVEIERIMSTPDRSRYWVAQTPQVFRDERLRLGYTEAARTRFEGTDDASFVEELGDTVEVIEGPRDNIKVTVAADLPLVDAVLAMRDGGGAR